MKTMKRSTKISQVYEVHFEVERKFNFIVNPISNIVLSWLKKIKKNIKKSKTIFFVAEFGDLSKVGLFSESS